MCSFLEGTWVIMRGAYRNWEKRGKEQCSIWKVEGHLIYIQSLGDTLTCDCMHTLTPIRPREMKNKVLKGWKWTNWDVEIGIEKQWCWRINGCQLGIVESLPLGFNMQGCLREQPTIGVLYWQNTTQTHNKCGALTVGGIWTRVVCCTWQMWQIWMNQTMSGWMCGHQNRCRIAARVA